MVKATLNLPLHIVPLCLMQTMILTHTESNKARHTRTRGIVKAIKQQR